MRQGVINCGATAAAVTGSVLSRMEEYLGFICFICDKLFSSLSLPSLLYRQQLGYQIQTSLTGQCGLA